MKYCSVCGYGIIKDKCFHQNLGLTDEEWARYEWLGTNDFLENEEFVRITHLINDYMSPKRRKK